MIIEQFLVTKYSNINVVNFLPEKIMYRRQNTQEYIDKTSRPFVFISP